MCSSSWNSKKHPFFLVLKQQQQQKKKPHVSVSIRRKRLRLGRRAGAETMELVNLKLYLENRCIVAENERLREKATALLRENLALRENLSKAAAEAGLPAAGAGAA
ncbi:protein LITTLE ZIPPER 1-like [Phragmites australis]|uniref:protein LITTLE ZIPPER 1-like n=1 Tax=Phragmites australis TaxID=29695 RepID=UPI002D791D14|nr:protein LITTLE ZIPPER 1-like [Phragmites australis]